MRVMRQEAFVNPDLLVWARESINMDVDAAAKKIGVKPDRLGEWEAGAKRPTVIQARKMSHVYRRPLATFYLPKRPSSLGFSVPHDFRRLPAEQPRTASPELIVELRRIEYLRNAAVSLAEERRREPGRYVGTIGPAEPMDAAARRVVELLGLTMPERRRWRTHYDALNGWRDAIERQGVLVMHLSGVEMTEARGIAIAEKAFPLIAINGKDSPNGRIFTLIHEFVHLMLGVTGISNLRLARRARTPEQRTERFCNSVAGQVLVPNEALLSHPHVQGVCGAVDWSDEIIGDLARHFHVSREVIVRRLVLLRRATDDFYRAKRRQYIRERESAGKRAEGRLPMSRRIIRAIGRPFAHIALDAYHREAISAGDLAELLGARLKHLPAVEELLGGRERLTGGER